MPFSHQLVLTVPTIPLGVLIVFLAVLFSVAGVLLVRRFIPKQALRSHHELTNAIFGAVALAYTVLLAFVVVISWQNYDAARRTVETEANSLVDLYKSSQAFSPVFREQLQAALKHYGVTVVKEEWPMLAAGKESDKAREAVSKLWDLYTSYEPQAEREKAFFGESISKLNTLRESRRLRIVESRTGVHTALWFVLLVGAVATTCFTFFFGAESFSAHIAMSMTLSVIIALILFTVLLFDFPFAGDAGIGPEMFLQIVHP